MLAFAPAAKMQRFKPAVSYKGAAVRGLPRQMRNLLFITGLYSVPAVLSLCFRIIPHALFVQTMKGASLCLCKNVFLERPHS